MTTETNDATPAGTSAPGAFEALLRAGFPYEETLGMRRVTWYPIDIALGAEGRIYCLRRGPFEVGGVICTISRDDENLGVISRPSGESESVGGLEGGWTWPVGIICDREERLIVSDEAEHSITTITRDGEELARWGEHGSAPGQLDRPAHMALDADGHLLVVDTMNHRVQRFTVEGEYIDGFGTHGSGSGELDMPWGIALDAEGCIYIGDWRNDRVQKFSPAGDPLLTIGSSGDGDGQLNRPAGVAVDQHGDIYVADRGNNRVLLFDRNGRYVERFIGDATISKLGRVYLMANAKVLRMREMTTLEAQKRFRAPASVRVDGDRLFVADFGFHRVQVYRKEAYPLSAADVIPNPGSPSLETV
ncbi:MAG: DNA-binding beta-propeller fold protein YncE [Chloroflexi bacterium]|jgi:DNA-binding beta-propeller fold protein YncE|nr:MAG: DNA-binding beta-propeller fold protein YncE [Chloroflexota bacterium]